MVGVGGGEEALSHQIILMPRVVLVEMNELSTCACRHYVVEGPPDSPYRGGYYHGVLTFPREYPFKPPSIRMITPNGRFQTNYRYRCLVVFKGTYVHTTRPPTLPSHVPWPIHSIIIAQYCSNFGHFRTILIEHRHMFEDMCSKVYKCIICWAFIELMQTSNWSSICI